jgi:hypothetical protein
MFDRRKREGNRAYLLITHFIWGFCRACVCVCADVMDTNHKDFCVSTNVSPETALHGATVYSGL